MIQKQTYSLKRIKDKGKDGIQEQEIIIQQNQPTSNFYEDNNFYIFGDFDESIDRIIVPNLLRVTDEQAVSKLGVVRIFVGSHGGYANHLYNLLAIIERAKALGVVVETFVFGLAASCASILAASGTKGHRYIGENAEHLCHLGMASFQATSDEQLKRESDQLKHHFDNVRRLYKKYARIKKLEKVLQVDSYFIRGKQIIENGLADHMFHP